MPFLIKIDILKRFTAEPQPFAASVWGKLRCRATYQNEASLRGRDLNVKGAEEFSVIGPLAVMFPM